MERQDEKTWDYGNLIRNIGKYFDFSVFMDYPNETRRGQEPPETWEGTPPVYVTKHPEFIEFMNTGYRGEAPVVTNTIDSECGSTKITKRSAVPIKEKNEKQSVFPWW